MMSGFVGWIAIGLSYQHCPPQKPAPPASLGDQVAPPSSELRTAPKLPEQPATGVSWVEHTIVVTPPTRQAAKLPRVFVVVPEWISVWVKVAAPLALVVR